MAAPSTAYTGALYVVSVVGIGRFDNNLAEMLSAYGSDAKQLFYLDIFENVRDGSTEYGFLGGIRETTNPFYLNWQMHNPTRWSVEPIEIGGVKYRVLNDAGLNTLGLTENLIQGSRAFTGPTAFADYLSAYYVDTDAFGIRSRYYNPTTSMWSAWAYSTLGTLPAQDSVDNVEVGVSDVGGEGLLRYQIESYITNVEGTYLLGLLDFTTTLIPVLLYPGSFGGSPVTYYINQSPLTPASEGGATSLYNDEDGASPINSAGVYYEDATHYLEYGYDPISGRFVVLTRVDTTGGGGTPSEPYQLEYAGYDPSSQASADAQVLGGAGIYVGTIYSNPVDGTWHTSWGGETLPADWTFGSFPADGFYAGGDVSEITWQAEFISGVAQ